MIFRTLSWESHTRLVQKDDVLPIDVMLVLKEGVVCSKGGLASSKKKDESFYDMIAGRIVKVQKIKKTKRYLYDISYADHLLLPHTYLVPLDISGIINVKKIEDYIKRK